MKKFSRNKKFQRPPPGRRPIDDDGDAVMDGGLGPSSGERGRLNPSSRFKKVLNRALQGRAIQRKGPRDFPDPHRLFSARQDAWFRLIVPGGRRLGQEFIVRELTNKCPIPFRAYNFHLDGQCLVFYVNDYRQALELRKLNHVIITGSATKMPVVMRPTDTPAAVINDQAEEFIKVAMSARYNTTSRVLNLSKFAADEMLRNNGLYLPLNKGGVLNVVVNIITDHIPEVEGLDLGQNDIMTLANMAPLSVKCKQLKVLKLAGNKIKSVKDLDSLKGLPVTEATFAGNPFTERYKDEDTYVSAIRERFPRVILLDQKELPPSIVFDLEEEKISVPRSQPSHLPEDSTRPLVVGFVEQYFSVFDSEDRSPLIDAYHEAGVFSLSSCTIFNSRFSKERERLEYAGQSRNLLRMQHDEDLKRRLLKQGRINIIDFHKSFEKTQHDPASFVVDVSLVLPTLMVFHVNGVFRERKANGFNPNLRSFQRTFAVVPQGAGLAIVNEEWFITIATEKQTRAYQEPSPSRPPSPATSAVDPNEEILLKFMLVTKMNRQFSRDCLVQHAWNPDTAFNVFTVLQQNGKIPADAFNH